MAELNPVSTTHVLLESMLQKLQLNTQKTNNGSISDMQTCSASEPAEDSSKTKVYQFGTSPSSNKQDGRTLVWNNWESSWTQQSPNFGSALTSAAKQPAKRITKHSGSSAKPKRPPLIWSENKRFISNDGNEQFSLEGETRSNVSPLYQKETFRNPPDLLAPTLTTSSSVLDKTEFRGQWSWAAESEKNIGGGIIEQPEKTTKTSRKKWGEPRRWAQSVKEKWKERRKGTQSRQRDDGQTQVQNEAQSNYSSLPTSIDVNNTHATLAETADIPQVVINTALDEDEGPSSPSYLSDSLLAFDTTSNLMEEIFSGTEWAQFLSVNHNTSDQSHEPPKSINQSHEEDWTGKWTRKDTNESYLAITQPSFLNTTSNKPVYNQPNTSQMSVADHNTNPIQTSDKFTNQSQDLNFNSEPPKEQSQLYNFNRNDLKTTEHSDPQPMSTQVSNTSQSGTEDFIPLSNLSCFKPRDRSSITSQGSLSRKREHWTKRRDLFEHTTQDMESEEEQSSSFMSTSNSSSLKSVPDSISEDPSLETAVKKRRMEVTRRVRFAEEVIVITASYLPEYNEEEDEDDEDYDEEEEEEEEEEVEKEDDNDWLEEPSPRTSLPKWIASLRGKSAKYKF